MSSFLRRSVFSLRAPRHLARRMCSSSPKPSSSSSSSAEARKFTFSWKSLALCAGVCACTALYFEQNKKKKIEKATSNVKSYGKPALGGPFVMFDQDGTPVTDASYRGKFVLLYFGFTFCPDICPNELVKLGKVITTLDKKNLKDLTPVFISLDPARDTLGQLRNYRQDFHPRIQWLTGTKDQIANVTRAFRVYFSKVDENDDNEEDYLVDHSIVMYLLSPTGDFLEFYTQRATISDIANSIEKYMKEEKEKTEE